MRGDFGGQQRFAQQNQVSPSVAVVEEAGQAIVAALHDLLGDVRQVETGLSGHAASLAADRPHPSVLIAESCVRNRLDMHSRLVET